MWAGTNIHDYVEDFMNNDIIFTSYWAHVVDYWKMRNESFIFFVTYEEMKRDLAGVLRRLCDFLEKPQPTEDEMVKLIKHLSFGCMKGKGRVAEYIFFFFYYFLGFIFR